MSGPRVTRNINRLTQVSGVRVGEYRKDPDQTDSSVRWCNHRILENNSSLIALVDFSFCRNFRKSVYKLDLLNVCVLFYVSYFCPVEVRLKRDTLRLIPLGPILEWELALVYDGQLVRNNYVSIVFVIIIWCRCYFST